MLYAVAMSLVVKLKSCYIGYSSYYNLYTVHVSRMKYNVLQSDTHFITNDTSRRRCLCRVASSFCLNALLRLFSIITHKHIVYRTVSYIYSRLVYSLPSTHLLGHSTPSFILSIYSPRSTSARFDSSPS